MRHISGNSKGIALVQMGRVSIHGEPKLSFDNESKSFKRVLVDRGLVISFPFTD
jgi:hypothetical protein